ncbi:hypothetical protein [Streptomyces sp. ODS28]|uniref:hypothetical protein n=1 Tax=Streptomyces sp. ODS28 TaxID=3136688 RepID=UPI0031EB0FC3
MLVPIHNPDGDPVLRRGERLVRYGGMLPMLAVLAYIVIAGLASHLVHIDRDLWRNAYYAWVAAVVGAGQIAIWLGMYFVQRSRGWESNVLTYFWVGAVVNTIAVVQLFTVSLLWIPWVAPVLATLAKRRSVQQRMQAEGGTTT